MNGAELLIKAAVASGIEYCFANPGTTEIPLVAALAGEPRLKPVLSLFEGVCTGAADGYGRIAERPALTLTHLGPGFANGIANLHNARRAHTPIVNVIGDHASWHVNYDPPLASDIDALAGAVSGWVRTTRSAALIGEDFQSAVQAAWQPVARSPAWCCRWTSRPRRSARCGPSRPFARRNAATTTPRWRRWPARCVPASAWCSSSATAACRRPA